MTTQDLAIHQAQQCRDSAEPVKTLLGCGYIPLALFYEELVKAGTIGRINDLSEEEKKNYWRQTNGSKLRRTWGCQALYLFELLNDEKIQP